MKIVRVELHGPHAISHVATGAQAAAGLGAVTIDVEGGGRFEAVAIVRASLSGGLTEAMAIAMGAIAPPPVTVVWYDRAKGRLVWADFRELQPGADLP